MGYAAAPAGTTYGVYGKSESPDGVGVYGWAIAIGGVTRGVWGRSASTSGRGVNGFASASSGTTFGVYGRSQSTNGRGVYGLAYATSGLTHGVSGWAASTDGTGVYGYASASGVNYGVQGKSASTSGRGVFGHASGTNYGVRGESNSTSGRGVYGYASASSGTTYGVQGKSASTSGRGVFGHASAISGTNYGVYGRTDSASGYAGYFADRVHVNGTLSKSAGSFKIDHPLDPQNKCLYHSFVESPDMMNIYNGNVTLDADGAAWVELPDWFQALNGGEEHRSDFRYQLTAIGAPGPNLYIAQEIADNRFQIAGGEPGMKVSWMVTGIRHDAYAEAHRIPVEEEKPPEERGTYLHPAEQGQPKELGLDYQRTPAVNDARLAEFGH